jgi:serine protease Do
VKFGLIDYVSHDAILDNTGNGSPLFTEEGTLIGINNFILSKGKEIGLALPIHRIISEIQEYLSQNHRYVTRCSACNRQVVGDSNSNCNNCGEKIELPNLDALHTTSGIGKTIESILLSMGYTLDLARIGVDHWEVERGSAAVNITYYEKNGLIIAEAYMCKLPSQSNLELYEFLLRQNQKMENLTFSVKGDDIILSLLIYDRYLNEQTGTELLTNLLDKSDHFDNILVEQFNCLWTSSRKLT